jgi:hypothetical protein
MGSKCGPAFGEDPDERRSKEHGIVGIHPDSHSRVWHVGPAQNPWILGGRQRASTTPPQLRYRPEELLPIRQRDDPRATTDGGSAYSFWPATAVELGPSTGRPGRGGGDPRVLLGRGGLPYRPAPGAARATGIHSVEGTRDREPSYLSAGPFLSDSRVKSRLRSCLEGSGTRLVSLREPNADSVWRLDVHFQVCLAAFGIPVVPGPIRHSPPP